MTGQDLKEVGRRVLSATDWRAGLAGIGTTRGAFDLLGDAHSALFVQGGPSLLVSFETRDSILRDRPDQIPFGCRLADEAGLSSLTLIAETETWFRDRAVYAFFDRLVDECLFDDFDQIVFYGAGMCGYAATAFSVAAPGSTVIAVQPQATLEPRVAGWDPRHVDARRLCFTDRYGFAPDMIEGADHAYILYDPEITLDAMHAALFARPWVTLLPCAHLGRDVAGALEGMHILPAMLKAACSGAFDAKLFRTFYRSRRNYQPYLSTLSARLERDGRPLLNGLLCRNVVERMNLPRFRAKLAEIEDQLRRAGEKLPAKAP